jgi:hypothetical protein
MVRLVPTTMVNADGFITSAAYFCRTGTVRCTDTAPEEMVTVALPFAADVMSPLPLTVTTLLFTVYEIGALPMTPPASSRATTPSCTVWPSEKRVSSSGVVGVTVRVATVATGSVLPPQAQRQTAATHKKSLFIAIPLGWLGDLRETAIQGGTVFGTERRKERAANVSRKSG